MRGFGDLGQRLRASEMESDDTKDREKSLVMKVGKAERMER